MGRNLPFIFVRNIVVSIIENLRIKNKSFSKSVFIHLSINEIISAAQHSMHRKKLVGFRSKVARI